MPKFTITYEDGTIKKELHFRNDVFSYTFPNWDNGTRKADSKSFEYQFEEKHPDDESLEEIMDYMYGVTSSEDDDIEEALSGLSDLE